MVASRVAIALNAVFAVEKAHGARMVRRVTPMWETARLASSALDASNGFDPGVSAMNYRSSEQVRSHPARRLAASLGRLARAAGAMLLAGALLAGCVAQTDLANLSPEQRAKHLNTLRPDWRDHFVGIDNGAILINVEQRWLVYWEPGGARSHAFPIAVPLTPELTRTGLTEVVRRKANPDWTATPSMIERNPEVPRYIPPGPQNPLGEYALYLGWQYFAIHGTNTPGAIGERATSGCFRLHSEDIEWLFNNVELGTPVRVVGDAAVRAVPEEAIGVSGAPSRELPPSALAPAGAGATPIYDDPETARNSEANSGASPASPYPASPYGPPPGAARSQPIGFN